MSEKQPKKKKTAGDVVLTVVLIAAICVFCYAGYNLFHIYTEYKKGTDEYNSITQMAVTERDPDGEAAGPEAGFMWKQCQILITPSCMAKTMKLIFTELMRRIITLQELSSWTMKIKEISVTATRWCTDII